MSKAMDLYSAVMILVTAAGVSLCVKHPVSNTLSEVPTNNATELEWTKYIAESKNGIHQYVCPDQSRVDVLTDEYAYEVEWANKWKEAPAQAVLYGMLTNKKPAIILLMKGKSSDKIYYLRCLAVCGKIGIRLETHNINKENK